MSAPPEVRDLRPRRRLATSVGFLVLGHVATVAVGLASVIVVSRLLGEEALGRWRLAQAIVAYMTVAADLGLTTFAVREIARRGAAVEHYAGPVLILRVTVGMILTVVAIAGLQLAAPRDAALFYAVAFLAVIPNSLSLVHVLQGQERLGTFALVRLATTAVAGALGLLSLVLTRELIALVVWPLAMGLLVDAWLVWVTVRRLKVRLVPGEPAVWAALVRGALPFLIGAVAVQLIANADAVIIGSIRGEAQLGMYAAAYLVAGQLLFLWVPIAAAVYPRLASLHQSGSRFAMALQELTGALGLIVLPFCIGAAVLAEHVVRTLYGQRYPEVAPLLAILLAMPAIGFYNVALQHGLNAAGRQRVVMRVSLAAAGISVVANLVVVSTIGLTGAAVTAVVVEVVTAVLYTLSAADLAGFRPLRAYLAPLLPAAVLGGVALAADRAGLVLPVVVVAAAAAYVVLIGLRPPPAVATLIGILRAVGRSGVR